MSEGKRRWTSHIRKREEELALPSSILFFSSVPQEMRGQPTLRKVSLLYSES